MFLIARVALCPSAGSVIANWQVIRVSLTAMIVSAEITEYP